jgi:hypothetical protein
MRSKGLHYAGISGRRFDSRSVGALGLFPIVQHVPGHFIFAGGIVVYFARVSSGSNKSQRWYLREFILFRV